MGSSLWRKTRNFFCRKIVLFLTHFWSFFKNISGHSINICLSFYCHLSVILLPSVIILLSSVGYSIAICLPFYCYLLVILLASVGHCSGVCRSFYCHLSCHSTDICRVIPCADDNAGFCWPRSGRDPQLHKSLPDAAPLQGGEGTFIVGPVVGIFGAINILKFRLIFLNVFQFLGVGRIFNCRYAIQRESSLVIFNKMNSCSGPIS
jgi:hypothetical protein